MDNPTLQGVVVEVPRRPNSDVAGGLEKKPRVKRKRGDSEFVYVNNAYVGSLNSVNEVIPAAPTRVIREQYWACAKWPLAQRILAVSVGILLGAVIGLAVTLVIEKVTSKEVGLFSGSARD